MVVADDSATMMMRTLPRHGRNPAPRGGLPNLRAASRKRRGVAALVAPFVLALTILGGGGPSSSGSGGAVQVTAAAASFALSTGCRSSISSGLRSSHRGGCILPSPSSSPPGGTSASARAAALAALTAAILKDSSSPTSSSWASKLPGSSLLFGSRSSSRRSAPAGLPENPFLFRSSLHSTRRRAKGIDDGADSISDPGEDPAADDAAAALSPTRLLLLDTKRLLQRASWLSWWCQVILTTVSSIILVFARNVLVQQQPSFASAPKLFLSTSGLLASALSIIWTWGNGQRLSRRLVRPDTSAIKAALLLRRAIRVGVLLNLAGLLLHLLAAEQIVGALAIKVLTMPRPTAAYLLGGAGGAALDGSLQPLDILIVQANTNSLLSHFCSLVLLLWLVDPLHRLDPPSTSAEDRRRHS